MKDFYWGLKFLDIRSSRTSDLRFGLLSDLIHGITENGLRHASGPVHNKQPIRYINVMESLGELAELGVGPSNKRLETSLKVKK